MKIYERPRSYRCVGKKCSYFMNPLNIPLLQIANFLWGEIQILKLIYREKATKVEKMFFKTTYLVTSKQCSMEKSFYSRQKKSPSINCPASYTQLLCSIFKREKASARASSDRFFVLSCLPLSLISSHIPNNVTNYKNLGKQEATILK